MKQPMKRGDLAKSAKCNIETIRYYEKIGLMPEPQRDKNGYRTYLQEDERRLRFILRARHLGFDIGDVRGLLDLVDVRDDSCNAVRIKTTAHLETVRTRIKDLLRLEKTLAETIAACSGRSAPGCPMIDALFGKG
jgi:MerR family transcriptional regulator, mercuric resistance operon regulatory protein